MSARVTVVGSLNMDLVVRSPRIPWPGETIIGDDFHVVPGGKGANQAVAAARLGARVSMVGRVGCDAFADSLLENLAAAGIARTFVTQDPEHPTGVALIVVDDAGQNSIVVAPGANMHLSPAGVQAAEAAIQATDVLLLQLEIPVETVLRAAATARAHGVAVVLNPAPARPLPVDLLPLVDVLVPNQSEAESLTGIPSGTQAGAEKAARALLAYGPGAVILTLGAQGALLVHQGKAEHVAAFEVAPVDTTAAGDAFLAGLAVALAESHALAEGQALAESHALAEGQALAEAVRWGNAAGALATTSLGAQPSLPTRQAVEELLASGIAR